MDNNLNNEWPASDEQYRLWFASQYGSSHSAYNIPIVRRLKGTLDSAALVTALNIVVDRHEALRTTFRMDGEQLVQVVASALDVGPTVISLGHAWTEANLIAAVVDEAERPFDLEAGPLIRIAFIHAAKDDCVLVINVHHAVADGWSVGIIQGELFKIYAALIENQMPDLPEIPIQFADYSEWLREVDAIHGFGNEREYWKGVLSGATPDVDLPYKDRHRWGKSGDQAGVVPIRLRREVRELLNARAAQLQGTPFSLLITCFGLLLSRYSRQNDLCICYPVAGRSSADTELTVGPFVNMLPIRIRCSNEESFEQMLCNVRTALLEGQERQQLPFSKILEVAGLERNSYAAPLAQAVFSFEVIRDTVDVVPGVTMESFDTEQRYAKFDLMLALQDRSGWLSGVFEYKDDRFDRGTIERMAAHFETLLCRLLREPAASLCTHSILTDEEVVQCRAWNEPRIARSTHVTLHGRFEAQVASTPNAIAVTCDGGELSYADLNVHANRLAHYLIRVGVRPSDRVAMYLERSIDTVAAVLAILKVGGVYVPIDPEYPIHRVSYTLRDAGAEVLLTDCRSAERLKSLAESSNVALPKIVVLNANDVIASLAVQPSVSPDVNSFGEDDDRLAYIIYTSGSTGTPKGCMVSHRNALRLFESSEENFAFGPTDVWTLFHSIAFDFSVWELWGALLYGGRLVVVPYWVARSPDDFHALLRHECVTVLNQTPTYFAELARVDAAAPASARPIALKYLIFGGEALEFRSLRAWVENHGDAQPKIFNMYGITETTVHVTLRRLRRQDLDEERSLIGAPLSDMELHLLDEAGQYVPVMVPGELYVAGPGVSHGYLNRQELTDQRFIRLPHIANGQRLYRSGDLGRRHPDGEIEFLGRIDKQVKIRGFRIELGEIEAGITAIDAVGAAAVLVDGARSEARLIGYVVPEMSSVAANVVLAAAFRERVRRELSKVLPEYMLPAHLVVLDKLPITPHGKLDVERLQAIVVDGHTSEEYVEPPTEMAWQMAAIWQEVLRVKKVGMRDNFFRLGGDSILAIQVVARARKVGMTITPRSLFEHPLIADLVEACCRDLGAMGVLERPKPSRGEQLLLPIQHWFLEQQSEPALHHFNFFSMIAAPKALDLGSCGRLLRTLVDRHAALRLRFYRQGSGWVGEYREQGGDWIDRTLQVINCVALPHNEQEAAIQRHVDAAATALNLDSGPVFRLVLYRAGDTVPDRFLLVAHHMVVDGVSWRVLCEDVETLLNQWRQGLPMSLDAPSTSLQAWAQDMARHAADGRYDHERGYWYAVMRGARTILPTTGIAHDFTLRRRRSLSFRLSELDTASLLKRSPSGFKTQINDLLLAALVLAVYRWAGLSSITLALEGHGREDLFGDHDLSQTVGWFTSKFPVRLAMPSGTTGTSTDLGDLILQTKDTLRGIPNRGVGYGVLRYLVADPVLVELERSAPPPLCFNYLGQWETAQTAGSVSIPRSDLQTSASPGIQVQHQIELNGIVINGVLEFALSYNELEFEKTSMEDLSVAYRTALLDVTECCVGRDRSGAAPSALDELVSSEATGAHQNGQDPYPATPMQQGLYFESLLNERSGAYVVQKRYRLVGVNLDLWRQSVQCLVDRHAALRTTFQLSEDHGLLQIVGSPSAVPWTHHDLSHVAASSHKAALEALLSEDANQSFAPTDPALFRCTLVTDGAADAVFIFSFHHALLDGWSVAIIEDELQSVYDQLHRGHDVVTLPPPVAYRGYLEWRTRQPVERARAYWRDQLAGVGDRMRLLRFETASAGERRMQKRVIRLAEGLNNRLMLRARDLGVTLNTLVQACWSLTLAAHGRGNGAVVFGMTSSGRSPEIPEVDRIVGLMIATVPLVVRLCGTDQLGPWLRTLALQQMDAEAFSYIGLPDIIRCSPGANSGGDCLFDSLVVFENYPVSGDFLAERSWAIRDLGWKDENHYPLTLLVTPGRQLTIEAVYAADRLTVGQVGNWLRSLEQSFELLSFAKGDSKLAELYPSIVCRSE